jgi:anti-sigma factor RsiW
MSCPWQEKLERYVDAELPESETAELDAHLRACPACAADALGRLQLKRMTQAAGRRYTPSPEFRLKIDQMVAKHARPARRWGWISGLSTAAAALAMVLVVIGLAGRHLRREQTLAELADLHVATLASPNPVDVVSTDRHTVKPWFAGKLPFTFNLPELENSPFKLAGGRVTYFHQTPGAHLLFDVSKHQISVFIFEDRPETRGMTAGSATASKMAFTIETWAEGGLRYYVVGDASAADIHALSELLRQGAKS